MTLPVKPLTHSFGAILETSENVRIESLNATEIMDAYKATGAVLFRGFQITKQEFVAFTNRFLTPRQHPVRTAESEPAFIDEIVYDVDPSKSGGSRALHAEASDTGERLSMCCFYCETAPPIGGETTVADGVEILARLSSPTRNLFQSKRVTYKFLFSPVTWQQYFGTSDRNRVQAMIGRYAALRCEFHENGALDVMHTSWAVCRTRYGGHTAFVNAVPEYLRAVRDAGSPHDGAIVLEDDSEIPRDIAAEVEYVCHECEFAVQWNKGDLVLVDNSRVMHGRRKWPMQYPRSVHARFGEPLL